MKTEKLVFCDSFTTRKRAFAFVKARTNKDNHFMVIDEWENGKRFWNVFKKVMEKF